MQYKMQFTVLDDAVKQNRKLPEIAFFDTDGNLIHLGGGDGGGGSVDLTHLTELGFGTESDVRLTRPDTTTLQLDGGQGETAYLYATNESELYADDLQEAWFYPGAVDLADYRYDNLVRLRTSDDIDHGLYVGKPGQRVIYGPDGMRFNPVAGVPNVSLLNKSTGLLNISGEATVGLVVGDVDGPYFGMYSNAYTEGYAEATDNWIHTVQVLGDIGTRGVWRADGSFQWGDGTGVPDVSLERTQWGGLLATTPDGLAVAAVDPDPAYNTAAVYLDHAGKITVQPAQPNDTAFLIGPAAVGDGVYRFQMDGHGQMWWSDGVNPEDVSLKRAYAGALGVGEAVYLDGLSGQVGVYPASDLTQPIFAGGLNGGSDRYQVLADGSIHWGDGTAAPDTHLSRSGAGALELYGGLSAIGHDIGATANSDWDVSYAAVMNTGEFQVVRTENDRIFRAGLTTDGDWAFSINARGTFEWGDGTATPDVKLQRAAAGVLEIPQHGGGFKLTSPDGSQTKTVRLSNAGALELV